MPTMKFTLMSLIITLGLVAPMAASQAEQDNKFVSEAVSRNEEGIVTVERFCGLLASVAQGTMTFEDGEAMQIAMLLFDNGEGKPRSARIIYGDAERISQIVSGKLYKILIRRYDDGSGFPRSIQVVESCK